MKQTLVIISGFIVFTAFVILSTCHLNHTEYREATPKEQAKYRIEDSLRIVHYTDTLKVKVR